MAPAPRDPPPGRSGQSQLHFSIFNIFFPTEIQAEPGDRVEMLKTRQRTERTMQELREIGTFPRRFLKKQLTNDRSAPFVSGGDERIIKMTIMNNEECDRKGFQPCRRVGGCDWRGEGGQAAQPDQQTNLPSSHWADSQSSPGEKPPSGGTSAEPA